MPITEQEKVIAELTILHEISSFDLLDSEESIGRNAIEKASRLFGIRYFAWLREHADGYQIIASWGFKNPADVHAKIQIEGQNQFRFSFKIFGQLFMEHSRQLSVRERRLYNIFARQLEKSLMYARNVAKRRLAEEEMEFKNTILQTQQEVSPDAILVIDENEHIISYNQQFIDLWHLSPQLVSDGLDGPVLNSVTEQVENSDAFVARIRYLYEHHDEKSHTEIQLKNGRTIERYSAPVTAKDGKYHGRVWYFRDITESKRLELEKEQYYKFFMLSINPMCIADPYGCFRKVNPAFVELTGYSESELISKPFLDFVLPGDRQSTMDEMKLQVEDRPTLHFNNRYQCKDGKVINLSWMAFYDKQDGITYATAIDTTERIKAEESLRQLSLAVEQSPSSIIITDLDAKIEYVNAAFVNATGYSVEEAIGQSPRMLSSGNTQKVIYDDMWAHLNRGEVWKGELINRRKDGGEYIESAWISPVRQPDGKVTHYLSINEDITQYKQAEAALRSSRENLHRLLNSIAEGAYGLDTQGDCTFVNRAFLQMLGYENDSEVLGIHLHELIHYAHPDGSPYPVNECKSQRVYLSNQAINVSDEVFWRKDGVAIPVEYWSHPIVSDGTVIGAIVTFIDITERKHNENKLTEQLNELRRWHEVTSGREGRILDLKQEVNELLGQTGKHPRYHSAESQDQMQDPKKE